ncbi:MAG: hypothetical protein M3Y34_01195, partial [Actinomycetota bacterium]|nr:hypothetical protein [Actinomycetota bacterium]
RVDRDGEFSFDNSGDGYIAYISGTITGKRAKGVLRFQGPTEFDEEPQLQTCDTGELEWSARKR